MRRLADGHPPEEGGPGGGGRDGQVLGVLRHTGIHFDAVRIAGLTGEQVAYELMPFADFCAGPIVRSGIGGRSMYFLLPPQTGAAYRWPAGRG